MQIAREIWGAAHLENYKENFLRFIGQAQAGPEQKG